MCNYCNDNSGECMYFKNPLDNEWYMEISTGEWDYYNDDFYKEREFGVKFCTYCGRKLDE